MALLILALLQRIFLMSSLMLLLVWLIFFVVLIKLLPISVTISGKTVKLMVFALICLGNNRQDFFSPNCIYPCHLLSFPTRRSSDLLPNGMKFVAVGMDTATLGRTQPLS